jgi:GntR family transcriptional regulator/MocR family aminotransferase
MHSMNGVDRRQDEPILIRLTDDNAGLPLHERLYQRIRALILSGTLVQGSKLESSRGLAASLGISRNSVLTALDRLIAGGWLEARKGSGVYVRQGRAPSQTTSFSLSSEAHSRVPFAHGLAAVDAFPAALWDRLQSRRWKRIPAAALQEGEAMGWPGLRQAICAHVGVARGLQCSPDQVMVTTSVSAALDLAARALGLAGAEVWVEDPGCNGFRLCLQNCSVQLAPVRVDDAGIDIEYGKLMAPNARAALVTPACEFPTCVTMSNARREGLLQWAASQNTWILEGDHDWQSVARKRLSRPLAAIDGSRTIYFDSFNSMLFPALRIGYLICPSSLVDRFIAVRMGVDGHSNVPNQMVMADFINGGHLDDHLRRLHALYGERRGTLIQSLDRVLPDHLTIFERDSGTRVVASIRSYSEDEFTSRSAAIGVSVRAMSRYRLLPSASQQAVFGYAAFSKPAIVSAVTNLRRAMPDKRSPPRRTADLSMSEAR